MSNGASLAPQLIKIDFAVLPAASLLILPYRKMLRIVRFQFLKQLVHGVPKLLIILPGFTGVDKFQQGGKILLLLWCLIPDIPDQRTIKQTLCL